MRLSVQKTLSFWGKQKRNTNNIVAKEATRPKLEGCLVAGVHKREGKDGAAPHVQSEHKT